MTERLFIRLGSKPEQKCAWLVWSEQEQEIIASGELSDAQGLTSLRERAGNRPVDVLVPSSAITLTRLSLPEKGQRQALKALPFMLEETLAADVDKMHFVVGPREGDALSIAVVAHEQMQTWLGWLGDAGLKAKRLVPDCLALPLVQCRWAALKFNQDYLLRTGLAQGMSLSASWLGMALPRLLEQEGSDNQAPPVTVASYTQMTLDGVEQELQELELPMLVLAKGILQAPMNLLSGAYAPKREYSKQLLQWKNAAIVVGVALVLALANKGLTIQGLNAQSAELKAQSEAIYHGLVPGNSRIVNLRSQLDSHLRSLQGSGGGGEFFAMLAKLQSGFKQVPELKPDSLRFDSGRNELRMQISAKDYAQIEKFKDIAAQSFQLDAGAMNSTEDSVTSTLTLRSK